MKYYVTLARHLVYDDRNNYLGFRFGMEPAPWLLYLDSGRVLVVRDGQTPSQVVAQDKADRAVYLRTLTLP